MSSTIHTGNTTTTRPSTNPTLFELKAYRKPALSVVQVNGGPRLLVSALRNAVQNSTSVQASSHVATPNGHVRVAVSVESERRRVALLIDPRPHDDVLALVYGAHDAVYVLDEADARSSVTTVLALLAEAEPGLFATPDAATMSALGTVRRIDAGRLTLQARGWDGTLQASIRRRRLNRPGEWSRQFNRAVDSPQLRLSA